MQVLEFPYAGTSGWSGSETSRERALQQDSDGTFTRREKDALVLLGQCRSFGMTWKDLAFALNLHHGQASGVLSVLHKTNRIARLVERRDKCAIYVLTEFINDRETSEHGNTKAGSNKSKLERLAELHVEDDENPVWSIQKRGYQTYCKECQHYWPCDTAKILGE